MLPVPLHAHQKLCHTLHSAVSGNTLPSAILLHGSPGIGKQRLALWLGQLLLCVAPSAGEPCRKCEQCKYSVTLSHPDLRWYFPRPRLKDSDPSPDDVNQDLADAIAERLDTALLYPPSQGTDGLYVATVRAIVRQASLSPSLGARKVFIVGDADRMVPQEGSEFAANALLKLLEEPPPNTTLILTSSQPGALLPTIRSRVAAFRLLPLTVAEMESFLAESAVTVHAGEDLARLRRDSTAFKSFLRAGAPGSLFGAAQTARAFEDARLLLDAASMGAAERVKAAYSLGIAESRGPFTEMLVALEVLLGVQTRAAVNAGQHNLARTSAAAVMEVESAITLAAGNTTPHLLGVRLLKSFARIHQ